MIIYSPRVNLYKLGGQVQREVHIPQVGFAGNAEDWQVEFPMQFEKCSYSPIGDFRLRPECWRILVTHFCLLFCFLLGNSRLMWLESENDLHAG